MHYRSWVSSHLPTLNLIKEDSNIQYITKRDNKNEQLH